VEQRKIKQHVNLKLLMFTSYYNLGDWELEKNIRGWIHKNESNSCRSSSTLFSEKDQPFHQLSVVLASSKQDLSNDRQYLAPQIIEHQSSTQLISSMNL